MHKISLGRRVALVTMLANLWVGMALAPAPLTVRLHPNGWLTEGGAGVIVTGNTRCAAGYEVVEALVYVVQDQQESQFAGLPVACDGRTHPFWMTVPAYEEGGFHAGPAAVSTYVLVIDPITQDTFSTGPFRAIVLR